MRQLLPLVALAALALPASAQVPDAPDRDGIHVVGAWTLTVLDPDGSVVERREFHNDLTERGADLLARLLSQGQTAGEPTVGLLSSDPSNPSTAPCRPSSFIFDGLGAYDGCYITTDGARAAGIVPGFTSRNLIVATIGAGDGVDLVTGVRLAGSATVESTSEIGVVRTFFGSCAPDSTPGDCVEMLPLRDAFTERDLGTEALAVQAGQTVNVQVDISFE